MPKLKLDNNFINKLNSLHRQKISSSTALLPVDKINKIKKVVESDSSSISSSPSSPLSEINFKQLQRNNQKFRKLCLGVKELNDVNLMWESFDDSIKKIVLNEIIEKYYFYKNWNFLSLIIAFFFGILFTFFTIIIIIIIKLL